MRWQIVLALLILALPMVNAETLNLHTQNNISLEGLVAKVSGDTQTTHIISPDNTIEVLQEGKLKIQVIGESIFIGRYASGGDGNVLLRPLAKMSGRVVDGQDNLLQHKPIKIVCTGEVQGVVPTSTDDIGFFTVEEIGYGICEVTAIVNNKAYTESISITESKHYMVSVRADDSMDIPVGNIWWMILGAIILALIITGYVLHRGLKGSDEKMDGKQKAILETLGERETEIVNLLFYDGALTQSQLRHKTGLPKSSLFRTLSGLKRKGLVIDLEESGVKKFTLSDRFRR